MDKIKKTIFKLRHFIAIGIIILIGLVCFWWIKEDTVEKSTDLWSRTIANDVYSTLTHPITDEKGIVQEIFVKADQKLYGININVHTFGRMCSGKIFADLYDKDGKLIASAQDDLANVYNDNFKRLMFFDRNSEYIVSREHQKYDLHIYIKPDTEEDKIALWKSDKAEYMFGVGVNDVVENNSKQKGTIAIQYITDYSNGETASYFKLLSALIIFVLVTAYIAIFVFKLKLHNIFLVLSLCTGLVFSFIIPLKGAPDEYVHMGVSYYNSNCLMGIEDSYVNGQLLMRECDYGDMLYHTSYTAFELSEMYNGLKAEKGDTETLTPVWVRWSEGYFPPLYWAQTIGITLARLLGLGRVPLFILGRLANLVMYTVLCYIALRVMPFHKNIMAVLALTPIPMQVAASFSYDTLVIGLCFIFIAKTLSLAYKKEKVEWYDLLTLVILTAFIAPSKAIYVVIVGFALIIPKEKFGGIKKAAASFAVMAVVAAVMWLGYNQNFVASIKESLFGANETVQQQAVIESKEILNENNQENGDLLTEADANSNAVLGEQTADEKTDLGAETQENAAEEQVAAPAPKDDLLDNGDSKYLFTPGYIITHIPDTIKLVLNTIEENTVLYIYQIFGGIAGEVILSPLHINWLYVIAVIAIVFMTTIKNEQEKLVYYGAKRRWGLLIALIVSMLLCIACITWTPANYNLIFGIQGRYFIPIMPLILMCLANNNITIKKDISRYLLFALTVVNMLIVLDAFKIMALNTKVLI